MKLTWVFVPRLASLGLSLTHHAAYPWYVRHTYLHMISESDILVWAARDESELLEFKREWPNLEAGEGKASFLKEVLALANSARLEEPAYLVFGVEDANAPDRICGVSATPAQERIMQLVSSYTNAMPRMSLHAVTVEERRVDVVRIEYSDSHVYHATRDLGDKLRTDAVYVRRGNIVGTLTLPELQSVIRSKQTVALPPIQTEPVISGFVELGDHRSYGRVTGRIVNVTDAIIEVSTVWHVSWAMNPTVLARPGGYTGRMIPPGEAVEDSAELSRTALYGPTGESIRRGYVGDTWYDVVWSVRYKSALGVYVVKDHSLRVGM